MIKRKEQTMKEKIECIAALEEYKQLFTDFFCNPKPRSVKVTRSFNIGEEKEILSNGMFVYENKIIIASEYKGIW